jgi:methylenetetrahydrofolate reductase (NADH)
VPSPSLETRKDERGPDRLSVLASLLHQGEFVLTAELNPPKSASAAVVRRRAEVLRGHVDAVNVTDSNRAIVAMAALPAAVLVREAGVEPIVQVTGRDRNRIAIQADLLGAAALGLENFLFMSGDDPTRGNHPDAVNVQDLSGTELVGAAVGLRGGRFLSGDELKQPPPLFIGATASPFAAGDEQKTLEKVKAGAEFLQTQPVLDIARFSEWLVAIRRKARDVAIIAGVLVLRSAEQAARVATIPGFVLPDAVRERMRRAADGEAEGIAIAAETIGALRALPGVNGAHLYAIEWPEAVPQVVARAGLATRPKVKEVATA